MKVFIYTLIAAAVVIGAYLAFNGGGGETPEQFGGVIIGRGGKIDGQYTLSEIIAIDESFKCEFESEDEESRVKGEIYIAPGAKVRGDFNVVSTATNTPFQSHILHVGGSSYTWTSLLDVGIVSATTTSSFISFDREMQYKCSRWRADQSKFELPDAIIFQSI